MGSGTYVAVCGPDPAGAELAAMAEQTGRLLARAGATVVCGGHGGVMEAVARGAAGEGGTVVGILPGFSRREGNAFLTVAIPTGMGELRNGLIVRAADAVIAIGGEFGTLSEVALSLKRGLPVIGLGTWRLSKDGSDFADPILRATSPEQAVEEALLAAKRRAGRG